MGRNSSCRKVMFSQACVKNSAHRGRWWRTTHSGRKTLPHSHNNYMAINFLATKTRWNRSSSWFITVHKRSVRRLCFHRCLSVQKGVCVQGRGLCPRGDLYLGGSLSGGGLCLGSVCPGQVSVQEGSLSRGALSVRPPYGYVQVVRILLERILVDLKIHVKFTDL